MRVGEARIERERVLVVVHRGGSALGVFEREREVVVQHGIAGRMSERRAAW